MGGISSEKDVSMLSGEFILNNLDKNKYDILPIPIKTQYELIDTAKCLEFAFIALHGRFGEDGTIQAILKSIGVPFTGSGVLSSSMCMDKNITKKILISENINTPKWIMISKKDFDNDNINCDKINIENYPVIVKPNNGGSSIGISLVKNKCELKNAILEAFKYDDNVMIEEYIVGCEIASCILDGKSLPTLKIIPKKSNWFNYDSKYNENGAEEIRANLDLKIENKIKHIDKICWNVFNLKGYARIDMIIKDDKIYVLEIDTLPGMTKNSLFPKSALEAGISYSELLDKIINCSFE